MSLASGDPEAALRRRAERRVAARRGFWTHATVYIAVNAGLVLMNLLLSPEHPWVLWPLFGWGVGLAAHAWSVFGPGYGDREQAVALEMERLRAREVRRF